MDFDYFLTLISRIEKATLGGHTSHLKMIPKERKGVGSLDILSANPKKAAVLAMFYPDQFNVTHFLLILRPAYDGTHASQISFPGGKFEKQDIDLRQTALRETSEEVGVPEKRIIIFKKMTDTFIPPSNFLVTPFVGLTNTRPDFRTNHEVEDLIEVKLAELLSEDSVQVKELSTSYMKNIEVPCFVLNNMTVWGATAMMLSEIKDLIKENLH
jgi:8-oxo-dGTP pyrophosphatase MutT (NUDIX family)